MREALPCQRNHAAPIIYSPLCLSPPLLSFVVCRLHRSLRVCVRQWAIPVSSINMVQQVNGKDGLAIMRMTFDAEEAKKQWDVHHRSKEKGELRGDKRHEFQFRTAGERQRFVNSIEAVYWQTARKRLNISAADK